jgi:phospholipid transport system transporter-binding protein
MSDAIFTLPQKLTVAETPTVLAGLEQALAALKPGATLTVDAAVLARFDSSALALLLQGRRSAARHGAALAVQGLPPRLAELAGLYGVAELV